MIEMIVGSRVELSSELIAALGRYRHEVFIERLGWNLDSTAIELNQEFDAFDTADTLYLIAYSQEQGVCGCSRLLPTTSPYLLGEVFKQLCTEPPPSHHSTWEMSRFAANAQEYSDLPMRIFWGSLQVALEQGVENIVGVVTPSIERYYKRNGVSLLRLGPPTVLGGETLIAIMLSTDQEKAPQDFCSYSPKSISAKPPTNTLPTYTLQQNNLSAQVEYV